MQTIAISVFTQYKCQHYYCRVRFRFRQDCFFIFSFVPVFFVTLKI